MECCFEWNYLLFFLWEVGMFVCKIWVKMLDVFVEWFCVDVYYIIVIGSYLFLIFYGVLIGIYEFRV